MIDRRTALTCAALIVLMLAGAALRIIVPADWLAEAARAKTPYLALLIFPACGAFVVGLLSFVRVSGGATKVQPWRRWGAFVSIGYCAILVLADAFFIAVSLDLGVHWYPSAIRRALLVLIGILMLLAVNQMPKLPYFERRFAPGGHLGPVYGPRFMRAQSRIMLVFAIALIAYLLALPPNAGWHPALYAFLATLCLFAQAIVWRRHLGRKWTLEQPGSRGVRP